MNQEARKSGAMKTAFLRFCFPNLSSLRRRRRACPDRLLQLFRGRIGGLLRFFNRVLSRVLRFFAKLLELRLRFLNLFVGSFFCLFRFLFTFCFVSSAFCLRSSDVSLSQPDSDNPNRAVNAMATEVIRFILIIPGS